MKQIYFLLVFLFFTIIGCTRYNAVVKVTKCNGSIDTLNVIYTNTLFIETYKEAVPILKDEEGRVRILNVCDYEILSKKKR